MFKSLTNFLYIFCYCLSFGPQIRVYYEICNVKRSLCMQFFFQSNLSIYINTYLFDNADIFFLYVTIQKRKNVSLLIFFRIEICGSYILFCFVLFCFVFFGYLGFGKEKHVHDTKKIRMMWPSQNFLLRNGTTM